MKRYSVFVFVFALILNTILTPFNTVYADEENIRTDFIKEITVSKVVDGKEVALDADHAVLSLNDTIKIAYSFNELHLNPINDVSEGVIETGATYQLPSLPSLFNLPSDSITITFEDDEELGTITFDDTGKTYFTVTYEADGAADITSAYAGFEITLKADSFEDESQETYSFSINEKEYTIKLSDHMPKEPTLTKTASKIDSDGLITWTVTLDKDDSKSIAYDSYSFHDDFGSEQTYVADSFTVVSGNTSIEPTVDETTISWAYPESEENTLVFTYQTKVDLLALLSETNEESTLSLSVGNDINVSAHNETYGDLSLNTSATVSIDKPVKKWVDKNGSSVDADGVATWSVVIQNNGFTLNNVTLYDELSFDDGVSITRSNIKVVNKNNEEVTFTPSDDGNTMILSLGDMAGDECYTLTYTTTIADFTNYLKENHKVPNNSAYVTYTYPSGDGTPVSVTPPKVTKNFTGTNMIPKAALSVKGSGVDVANRTLTWDISVNSSKQDITGAILTNTLAEHNEYVEITDFQIDGEEANIDDYATITTTSDTVTLDFENHLAGKTATYVLTTHLSDEESAIWASNNKKSYTDKVSLTTSDGKSVSDSATQTYTSNILVKKSLGFDYNTRELKYQLLVDTNEVALADVTITDTFTEGVFVEDSFTSDVECSHTYENNTLTINFPTLSEKATIDFAFKVENDSYFTNTADLEFSNTASLTSSDYTSPTSVSTSTDVPYEVIAKAGTQRSGSKEIIDYVVAVNPARANLYADDISEVVVQDIMGASLVLDEDSVALYTADVASDGSLKANEKITTEVHPKDADNKTILEVVLPKDYASSAFVLKYTAKMLDKKANDFTNSVSLQGYGEAKENNAQVDYNISDFSGAKLEGYVYLITLIEDGDTHTPLEGVEFALKDGDGKTLYTKSSDKDGEITFVGKLSANTEYTLHQKTALEGYVSAEDTIVSTGNTGLSVAENAKGDHTIVIYKLKKALNIALVDQNDTSINLLDSSYAGTYEIYQGNSLVYDSSYTTPFTAVYGETYTIREGNVPYGYVGKSVVGASIKIAADSGEFTFLTNDANATYRDGTITLYDHQDNYLDVAISDQNSDGKYLEGATMTITKDGKTIKQWTSTPAYTSVSLVAGDYVLTRTTAPNGYVNEAASVVFQIVDEDGLKLKVTSQSENTAIKDHNMDVKEISDASAKVELPLAISKDSKTNEEATITLYPLSYVDGLPESVIETALWSSNDGTPLEIEYQREYALVVDAGGVSKTTYITLLNDGQLYSRDGLDKTYSKASSTDENGNDVFELIVELETPLGEYRSHTSRKSKSTPTQEVAEDEEVAHSSYPSENTNPNATTNTLPNTGSLPVSLFYTGGLLLILSGLKARKH